MKFKCQLVLILLITFFQIVDLNGSRRDRGMVTPGYGRDSSSVATQLSSGVTEIFSTSRAFAALKKNGSVVTWGNESYGGDSSSASSELSSGVVKIFSNNEAFAALKKNGSVVTWGNESYGGDSSSASSELSNGVTEIFSTSRAFAALKKNGSVVTWGDESCGGDIGYQDEESGWLTQELTLRSIRMKIISVLKSSIRYSLLRNVVTITSNNCAFAALKENGSVVTWGDVMCGGDSEVWARGYGYRKQFIADMASKLRCDVIKIFSTNGAFAALKQDGSVVTWGLTGDYNCGIISSDVASDLHGGVVKIFSTVGAFAALKEDGSVIVWGDTAFGGPTFSFRRSSEASKITSGVVEIFSTDRAFAALKEDGSVVTW